MLRKLLKRLKEPSTWAGVSVIATIFGVPTGLIDAATQIVIGATAAAAILLPEKGI